ncbi:hypothetical protein ACFQMF_15075 [Halorubrum rutilum]|uniref:Transposase DDE domain-containing protein n=1 Tax=Halorubrum rutilum TaxID=1364933 RepID=A0ABD6ANL5_9EURY
MTQFFIFIGEVVPVAQRVTGDGGESADPEGGGGFVDYALVSLHRLRIYLDSSYRMTIDLLKEMSQITGEIGLNAADLRSLAAYKGYDKQSLREGLRELGIRPLIKHSIFAPYDHAHNARIDDNRYNQRPMTGTVNSAVKRSLGFAVRARSWFREFSEIALMCVVYNIKRFVKQ